MGEKGANIDLLFRNGLKDFEVLPPADVWEGIKPTSKIRYRPILYMRIAAVATVVLALSFLTYRLSREGSSVTPDSLTAFNVQTSAPVRPLTPQVNINTPSNQIIYDYLPTTGLSEESAGAAPIDSFVDPSPINNFAENKSILLKDHKNSGELFPSILKNHNNSSQVRYADLQYLPEDIKKSENRWSIEAMASPTYYSRFSSGGDEFSKQLMSSEQPVISYSGGLALAFKLSKRLSIQSGLYYSSLGQKVDGINSFSGFKQYDNSKGDNNFQVLTTGGTIIATNPDVFLKADASNRVVTAFSNDVFDPKKASLQYINSSITQSLSYLELPVILRYKIIDKTIGVNLIGGLSYNLLVHNSVYTTVDGGKYQIGDTKGLNPLALSSSLGMGMEYNFSTKLSLNLEPTFRYYLNPFSVTTGTFSHPYSFGIFSGISYKF